MGDDDDAAADDENDDEDDDDNDDDDDDDDSDDDDVSMGAASTRAFGSIAPGRDDKHGLACFARFDFECVSNRRTSAFSKYPTGKDIGFDLSALVIEVPPQSLAS
jgi:hypothetical protein